MCAITREKLIHLGVQSTTFTADDFIAFLDEVVTTMERDHLVPRSQLILFFDNAPCHKAFKVRDYLKDHSVTAITNCPYAPELNLAEKFIRAHKRQMQVRRRKLM